MKGPSNTVIRSLAELTEGRESNPLVGPETGLETWAGIAEIFFLSAAKQSFQSQQEKSDFLARWTGYYRDDEPESTLIAQAQDGTLAGYLTGCRNSAAAARLFRDIAYYSVFQDLFAGYPAHFHINCHPSQRGQGLGTGLAAAFIDLCAKEGREGIHVVTAPEARNVSFYRRLGFDREELRPWQERDLLFMGRKLR